MSATEQLAEGIRVRVGKKGTHFEASVYLPGGGRRSKTFPTERAAVRWREATRTDIRRGKFKRKTGITVAAAADQLVTDMEEGLALTRSRYRYKPSVIRSYRDSLKLHITPLVGGVRIEDVTRSDVQHLVDTMLRRGASPSTVRNSLLPLRVIFRQALQRGLVETSPCEHVVVPAVRGRRDRIATPEEAAKLLAAVPDVDRPIWATAFYAGLRRGELRGLRGSDIDRKAGLIHVRQAMDELEGVIDPKTKAGTRKVPLLEALRPYLENVPAGKALAFPSKRGGPFNIGRVRKRAIDAWRRTYECGCRSKERKIENVPERCPEHDSPSLAPIGLHECRHTLASLCIAAGVNAKALSTFMRHSSISVTYDLYGHLMPDAETAAATQIDAYLTSKTSAMTSAKASVEGGDDSR
jgi:integrase